MKDNTDLTQAMEIVTKFLLLPAELQTQAIRHLSESPSELASRVHALPPTIALQSLSRQTATQLHSATTGLQSILTDPGIQSPIQELTVSPAANAAPGVLLSNRYSLKEKIGEGGMGEVWLAHQREPIKRNVAVKFIKAGIDSRIFLSRFEQERQALAVMDHPHIAKVLDGGMTPWGQPFFIMEFVQGAPLTQFCDREQLSLIQRLELFSLICQAVHHAHQKGIIHRDLKPANILVSLVDGRATPKVIDFGVAKAAGGKLIEETISTGFGLVIGTLEYMSPEQAGSANNDIDTRSDVYSLGVILYELLTGFRPFDSQQLRNLALPEVLRMIQETEPQRPSTRLQGITSSPKSAELRHKTPRKLADYLRGELDWITMKCLEKNRDRRYDSANSLSRDIGRFLHGDTVEARPPSASYRLQKFVGKNKALVSGALAIGITLIAGIIGTSIGFYRAETARASEAKLVVSERDARTLAQKKQSEAEEAKARANAKAESARRNLYIAHMNLAQSSWESSHTAATFNLLDRYGEGTPDADLRGLEWNYWDQMRRSSIREFIGHTGRVTSVAYSPDGKRLATTSDDRSARVWDAINGKELYRLNHPGPSSKFITFNFAGNWLATAGGPDSLVKLWDAATGLELRTFSGHTASVESVAFSPIQPKIASASADGTVKIWDCDSDRQVTLRGHAGPVESVVFSPDGKQLATASQDRTVGIWDVNSGGRLHTLGPHNHWAWNVAYSPDGRLVASVGMDHLIRVLDAETGVIRGELKGHTDQVTHVTFSPDGTLIATTSSDQTVRLWSVFNGAQLRVIKAHPGGAGGIAFSPDGNLLATAGEDGIVRLWDALSGQDHPMWKLPNVIASDLAISPSADHVAWICNEFQKPGQVVVSDIANGKELFRLSGHSGHLSSIAYHPNGRILASASEDGTVKLWSLEKKEEIRTLRGNGDWMNSVAFSPEGKCIAAASGVYDRGGTMRSERTGHPGEVRVWDVETGEELNNFSAHSGPVTRVRFSPLGEQLASSTYQYFQPAEVIVWDAKNGTKLFHQGGLAGRALHEFSPDGRYLAIADGEVRTVGKVRVLNAKDHQVLYTLQGHTDLIMDMAFAIDGERLVTTSADKTVKIWDTRSGQETLTINDHQEAVRAVAFFGNGKRIATSGNDFTIRFFDLRPWTVELQEEREAHRVVNQLLSKGTAPRDLLQAIQADATIPESVRAHAVRLASKLGNDRLE